MRTKGVLRSTQKGDPITQAIHPETRIGHVHLKVADLARDRPEADWPKNEQGFLAAGNRPLDLEKLLSEALAPV